MYFSLSRASIEKKKNKKKSHQAVLEAGKKFASQLLTKQ